mmetsp:Transcript_87893/g.155067  ORF Transcript_87893/g.155067 Transcript_87893/m.155067 type:complete len:234 (-) Transcript_87893:155-856(-)
MQSDTFLIGTVKGRVERFWRQRGTDLFLGTGDTDIPHSSNVVTMPFFVRTQYIFHLVFVIGKLDLQRCMGMLHCSCGMHTTFLVLGQLNPQTFMCLSQGSFKVNAQPITNLAKAFLYLFSQSFVLLLQEVQVSCMVIMHLFASTKCIFHACFVIGKLLAQRCMSLVYCSRGLSICLTMLGKLNSQSCLRFFNCSCQSAMQTITIFATPLSCLFWDARLFLSATFTLPSAFKIQ